MNEENKITDADEKLINRVVSLLAQTYTLKLFIKKGILDKQEVSEMFDNLKEVGFNGFKEMFVNKGFDDEYIESVYEYFKEAIDTDKEGILKGV